MLVPPGASMLEERRLEISMPMKRRFLRVYSKLEELFTLRRVIAQLDIERLGRVKGIELVNRFD